MVERKKLFLFLFLATMIISGFLIQSNQESIADPEPVEEETFVLEREEEEIIPDPIIEEEFNLEEEIPKTENNELDEPIKEEQSVTEAPKTENNEIDKPIEKRQTTKEDSKKWVQKGIASWYGDKFHGRTTANGEKYDMYAYTAAHKELPFGTIVKVTHIKNGRSVRVRINDRGPFIEGRIIDLSRQAAEDIGLRAEGIAEVKVEIIESP